MLKKISIFFICFFLVFPSTLQAHGVRCKITKSLGIQVYFDSGSLVTEAEVKIYAPGNRKTPFLKCKTNLRGEAFFTPNKVGLWIIVVKDSSGHGLRKDIEVNSNMITSSKNSSLDWTRKIIMAICVVWGFIGTALFFVARKKRD